MEASTVSEDNNVEEPNVIYDTNPQILTGETNVYKMWYTGGWDVPPSIHYAESADGVSWTKYESNPVVEATHARSNVRKVGSTYIMYTTHDNTAIDLYTSSDGVTWALDTASVLTVGANGTWDDTMIGNCHVWQEGATYYMLYDANDGGNGWKLGLATSSDGKAWTKYESNPVLNILGGAWVTKEGSYYYLWCHGNDTGLGLPSDIYRFRSTDLINWTAYPGKILSRTGADKGAGGDVGQIADPFIIVRGDTMMLYYSASSNGGLKSGGFHIKLATDPAGKVTA